MIRIDGHSNYIVECRRINDVYYIFKSGTKSDATRLERQIQKQVYLYDNNFLENLNCKIPNLYRKIESEETVTYVMEYIKYSENLIDFLVKDNNIKVNWLCQHIISIIDAYIVKCDMIHNDKCIFDEKIITIEKNVLNNSFLNEVIHSLDKYISYIKDNSEYISRTPIPVGICHGDMTFSNILIDTNNMQLYLIDFLDSFIETPLFDIIKVRQDTCFYWTMNLCNFDYDKNKVIIVLNYIDKIIDNYFNKYEWYIKTYQYFQIMNILRVIQYCKEEGIRNKLMNYLESFDIQRKCSQ